MVLFSGGGQQPEAEDSDAGEGAGWGCAGKGAGNGSMPLPVATPPSTSIWPQTLLLSLPAPCRLWAGPPALCAARLSMLPG